MNSHQIQPPCKIILFTRYPDPGKVKTRLIPILGKNGAAQIHRTMTEHVLRKIKPVTRHNLYHLSVYYTGSTENLMRDWLGNGISFKVQDGHNLGHRMATAFSASLAGGSPKTVLIGSDCPFIDDQILLEAFEQLNKTDMVIGPTYDGGYYLIGLNGNITETKINVLFENISWGTPTVYKQTIRQAGIAGLTIYPLRQCHDIDRPEDLEYFNYNPDTE